MEQRRKDIPSLRPLLTLYRSILDPACVVYDRDTVLGGYADSYEAVSGQDQKIVYFDIGSSLVSLSGS